MCSLGLGPGDRAAVKGTTNFTRSKHTLREWVSITASAVGAAGAWGALAAVLARALTPISEVSSLLFVALPVGLAMAIWLWPKLPKILGFRGEGEA